MTREKKGKVVGPNKKPVERVRRDKPTHACFHDDGSVSLVHADADGYEDADLVRLPRGYSDQTHEPDFVSRSFVRRSAPLAGEASLRDRIESVERRFDALAALMLETVATGEPIDAAKLKDLIGGQ